MEYSLQVRRILLRITISILVLTGAVLLTRMYIGHEWREEVWTLWLPVLLPGPVIFVLVMPEVRKLYNSGTEGNPVGQFPW